MQFLMLFNWLETGHVFLKRISNGFKYPSKINKKLISKIPAEWTLGLRLVLPKILDYKIILSWIDDDLDSPIIRGFQT